MRSEEPGTDSSHIREEGVLVFKDKSQASADV